MTNVTGHCIVKNEEVFIEQVLRSALDFVDQILVFDTGSTDSTVEKINKISAEFPGKIIFEEKGECDKKQHTLLRQEMVDRTKTDWFMILDGDEVWPHKTMEEAVSAMEKSGVECIVVPFYLCVGDAYHQYYKRGQIQILGMTGFQYPRFIKKTRGVHWQGDYNQDNLFDSENQPFVTANNAVDLKNKFWHLTHLRRSSNDDNDYSSGGTRLKKRRLSYFFIGRKINEPVPESLKDFKLGQLASFVNFLKMVLIKLI